MKRNGLISCLLAASICASFSGCGSISFIEDAFGSSGADMSSAERDPAEAGDVGTGTSDPVAGDTSATDAADEGAEEKNNYTPVTADISSSQRKDEGSAASYGAGIIDGSGEFSERDLRQSADLSDAVYITVRDGETIDITEEGVYVISGTASECTVRVEAAKDAKVQLVLDGASIDNSDFPAIYVVSADKVFVTSVGDNSLSVSGEFRSDGDTNTDAVIFSRSDLTFSGAGTLKIFSALGNGISGKDDVKITGGVYEIKSALDAVEANDSIRVCGGSVAITTDKDGFHAENDDDDTLGYVYISGGTISVKASDDGIHANSVVQIDGGDITVSAHEGIEGTVIQINDGNIGITASDDGINAARKSSAYAPAVEINGGSVTVAVGQGDTDAIDSNGDITVNGGTIEIMASSSFDYDGRAYYNGGTIIINGERVDSIPQSMFGGGQGGGGFGGGQGNGGGFGGGRGSRGGWEDPSGGNGGFPGGGWGFPSGDDRGTPPEDGSGAFGGLALG